MDRNRPLIGICAYEVPAAFSHWRDVTSVMIPSGYTRSVHDAGGLPLVLPPFEDNTELLDLLDGLVFSGGPDLDPATYGHERHPQLGPDVDRVSDEYELALLREATARDLPLLGICRGMQALNVARGGTLHQHLPDRTGLEHRQTHEPHEAAHAVTVRQGTPLHRLTRRRRLDVNSFHHQAVDRLGARLAPAAHAPDGTIEAIYDPQLRFCLGVQWHAELLTHRDEHAPLLHELVAAAATSTAATPLRLAS